MIWTYHQQIRRLKILTTAINKSCKQFGMIINDSKTKTLVITKTQTQIDIVCNTSTNEQVDKFTYLGSIIASDESCTPDIK